MKPWLLDYPLAYFRRPTRSVRVKNIKIGSTHNLVIQSMLTCHTTDTAECLAQIKRLVAAGCEMVRLSIMSKQDLAAIPKLLSLLRKEAISVPLVADVHFAAHLAVSACEFFDKVRINPGNFSDRPKNYGAKAGVIYDFHSGRQKLQERIKPLAAALKKYKRALRIGVNHGSLSERMIQKFGDSPLAMVESALEMAGLFAAEGVSDIVVSLKSSNPLIVQKAYRLFAKRSSGPDAWPLHLGVTEAGNQTAGRIKSLCGIGPLLADGIGDTIRVSLTEDSVNEVRFAKSLRRYIQDNYKSATKKPAVYESPLDEYRKQNPFTKLGSLKIGAAQAVKIGLDEAAAPVVAEELSPDFRYSLSQGKLTLKYQQQILAAEVLTDCKEQASKKQPLCFASSVSLPTIRKFYRENSRRGSPLGFMIAAPASSEDYSLEIKLSALLSEGLLDFILVPVAIKGSFLLRLLAILQAVRVRLYQTDYVACPSCGRTMFDIAEVTKKIKARTSHLKGVKIGILGCMVNGPGEMADADFGYVGSSAGTIDLYRGHKRVQKNIPIKLAIAELITLIKNEGYWVEPQQKN